MLSAELVKDINQTGAESRPTQLARVGDRVFFAANDGVHGIELWVSNGTSGGTYLVKDINPGPGDSSPRSIADINGIAYFSADDGVHGLGLWKSDGTSAGTVLVKEMGSPQNFHEFRGMLIFVAQTDANGYELWKSDGTAPGTIMLKDIRPGTLWGVSPYATFENYSNSFWFSTYDGGSPGFMWKTDGTPEGTVRTSNGAPSSMTQMGGYMYYVAPEGNGVSSLWKMDGAGSAQLLNKVTSHP